MSELAPNMPGGWIQSLRKALGIPRRFLAKRLGVHPTTLMASERGEQEGTITVSQLRKVAAAMDCQLVYALVPQNLPSTTLEQRAQAVADAQMARLLQTMKLENQLPDLKARKTMVRDLRNRLMQHPRLLWRQ